jgi:hypothetical protein
MSTGILFTFSPPNQTTVAPRNKWNLHKDPMKKFSFAFFRFLPIEELNGAINYMIIFIAQCAEDLLNTVDHSYYLSSVSRGETKRRQSKTITLAACTQTIPDFISTSYL